MSSGQARRIVYVVNDAAFFVSHRLAIATAARDRGYDVHVATAAGLAVDTIRAAGLSHHPLPLTRSGLNPAKEFWLFILVIQLLRQLKPEIVHLVTIKPVIYGGIAARILAVPHTIAAISGLGYTFLNRSFRGALLRSLIVWLYRLSICRTGVWTIFQNRDDLEHFIALEIAQRECTSLIRGSGVDLHRFQPVKHSPNGVVMFASRLLWDKGVGEFAEAARLLKQSGSSARFVLVGDIDPGNRQSVTSADIETWKESGVLEWWGQQSDMNKVLAEAQIVVLPSYREGLPKILAEAAAMGIAVVTTDVPGCRDAIIPGVTGIAVPVRDARHLADSICELLRDPDRCSEMGAQGRELAVREFSIDHVIAQHMSLYDSLPANDQSS